MSKEPEQQRVKPGLVRVNGLGKLSKARQQSLSTRVEESSQLQRDLQLPSKSIEFVRLTVRGEIASVEEREVKYERQELGNGVAIDMVCIPEGLYLMGSPASEKGRRGSEGRQHGVSIGAFKMSETVITQEQWRQVAQEEAINQELNPDPSRFKGSDRPVEGVSWHDAQEFCARLRKKIGKGYRLPTEAEWEYGCRAGTRTPFHYGETISSEVANYYGTDSYGDGKKGEKRGETTPVKQFRPNGFGLYDMHGNVWEWCEDVWHENYKGAPKYGSAWVSGNDAYRIQRGGSWYYDPAYCRSAYRNWWIPGVRYYDVGFRVVCALPRTSLPSAL